MRTDGLLVVATPVSSACSTSWTKFGHRRVVLRVRSTSFALALYELDLTVIISLSRALALPARPCWSSPRCCTARVLFKLQASLLDFRSARAACVLNKTWSSHRPSLARALHARPIGLLCAARMSSTIYYALDYLAAGAVRALYAQPCWFSLHL